MGLINGNSLNWAESEKAFKRSIELSPNYATARHWYSRVLAVLGRKDEALAEIKRANELDPLSLVIMSNVSDRYQDIGDYQSAIEQCRKLIEIDPGFFLVHNSLARIYLDQKRPTEALAAAEKARDNPGTTVYLGMAYARLERRNEALAMIKILEERFANGEERAATAQPLTRSATIRDTRIC
ncbi:MAG: tetratricopeptide repeat protein [Acidobacteria bacterium]|nr:tetratricopeptide repeat protein [Acidobacteriota bacterium]